MRLKDYIAVVLKESPLYTDIYFSLSVVTYDNKIYVTDKDSGLKISFTVLNTPVK